MDGQPWAGSGSGRLDGEAGRLDMLTPADRAGRGPVEAVSLPEDEAAAETPGRLDAEPLRRRPERAGDVAEVIGDLLLWDPHEARELVGSARAFAEVAKQRFTDSDQTLGRWALTSWRSHFARVLPSCPIGPRTIDTPVPISSRPCRPPRGHAIVPAPEGRARVTGTGQGGWRKGAKTRA
jgi:hypothetical protein